MAAVGTLTIEMAANVARLQGDMERATKTVGGAMAKIERSVQSATRALGVLTAAFAGYKAVQGILQQADAMTQLNSRLQLVTRTQEEFVKTQASLISIAQRSYTSLGATVDLYTALARSTREVGVSQNELLRVVETFNKSIIISGGSVQAAEAAITQFNQAMASGVLRGEEFNSISEQAPMIMELLANALGVTRGALRDMAKEGLLVAELVLPALIEGSKGVDQQFAQMNKTVGQAGQQMKNSFMLFLDELNRGQDITSTFAGAIDTITSGLDYLTRLLRASQGDLSDYIDTQAESAKFARQQAEAMKEQEEAVKSRARAMLEEKERMELAKKAAEELQKTYEKLIETLRDDIRGSTAALQAEQQGLNKAQEDFLKLVASPQWKQYTAAQKMLITDLYKQRIETEKLIDAEKERAKAAEDRLKKMLDDEKEFLKELEKEDKKIKEDRIKAQEKLYEEHRKEIEKVGDQLTDALMRAFESGKGFGQAFKDTLVNMFRTMVLRPVLAPISGAVAGAFSPQALAAGGGAGGSMGMVGGLVAGASTFGSYLATGFMNTIAGTGFGASMTAAGSLMSGGSIAGGAGMAAGAALPYVAAAVAVYKLLQGDGKDPTGRGAFVSTRDADITRGLIAETTGFKTTSEVVNDFFDRANDGLKPVVETVVNGILDTTQSRARAIGLDIALGIDAGLVTDPEAKQSYGYASIFMGGERIANIVERSLGQDFEQATAKFSQILQEEVAQAVLDAGNVLVPAGQSASQVLERLGSSIMTANQVFDSLRLTMFDTSIAGAEMAANLMDLLGGVESFTQLSAQYYQEFYSEGERSAEILRQLTISFDELGVALPASRDGFRALVEAQDLTTESGRETFAALMRLSPAFASITQNAEEAFTALQQDTDKAFAALQRAIDAQRRSIELSRQAANEQLSALESVFSVLTSGIENLIGDGMSAASGRAFIDQAIATARATGYLPDANDLQRAINAAIGATGTSAYASAFEMNRDRALLASRLTTLRDLTGEQLTGVERQVQLLDDQLTALDDQLSVAQKQLEALRGIDNSILSLADAMALFASATGREGSAALTSAARSYSGGVVVGSAGSQSGMAATEARTPFEQALFDVYDQVLGRVPDIGGLDSYVGSGKSIEQIASEIANSPEAQVRNTQGVEAQNTFNELVNEQLGFSTNIKARAAGGFARGLTLVGENGPELVNFADPGMVYSASQTRSMMTDQSVSQELANLRSENKAQMRALVSLQARMTRLLERWDGDGLPEERAVA